MPLDARATAFSLPNAQILAQASAIAYQSSAACEAWAKASGLAGPFDFFDNRNTQGFVAQSEAAIVVAFRGTQPNQPMDWLVDFDALRQPWDSKGKVHRGFHEALGAVWGVKLGDREILPRRLLERGDRTVWITGHSLGGALAELCAAQASLVSHVPVQGVYTFGQPRVGDDDFANVVQSALGSRVFRFVNDKDIVPGVPLFSMGYRHYGSEMFFDKDGQHHDRPSTVESLVLAARLAALALNFDPLVKVGELLVEAAKKTGLGHHEEGAGLAQKETAARENLKALLHAGAQNIEDHDISKCYMVRLGTALPA